MDKEDIKNVARSLFKDALLIGGFALDVVSFVFILASPDITLRFYYSGKTVLTFLSGIYSHQKCNAHEEAVTDVESRRNDWSLTAPVPHDPTHKKALTSLVKQKLALFFALSLSWIGTIAACELLIQSRQQDTSDDSDLFPRNGLFNGGMALYAISTTFSLIAHGIVHHNIRIASQAIAKSREKLMNQAIGDLKLLNQEKETAQNEIAQHRATVALQEEKLKEAEGKIEEYKRLVEEAVGKDHKDYVNKLNQAQSIIQEAMQLQQQTRRVHEAICADAIREPSDQRADLPMTPPLSSSNDDFSIQDQLSRSTQSDGNQARGR